MFVRAIKNEETGHYHIGYIRPDNTGVTSVAEGHAHEIVSQTDPQGQIISTIQEAAGHTHEIGEFGEFFPEEPEFSEDEEIEKCKNLYSEARALDEDSESMEDAKTAQEFFEGKQWDPADEEKLRGEDRAVLTLNELKPKCDVLQGNYIRNKTDIRLLPEEDGDQLTADILNMRIKNILNKNKWDMKESRIIGDVIRVGRGVAAVKVDIDNRGVMQTKIEYRPWDQAFFGPHLEPDGSDVDYAGLFTDVSKEQLKGLYPDKADEIEEVTTQEYPDLDTGGGKLDKRDQYNTKNKKGSKNSVSRKYDKELADIAKKKYRLVEVQYKKFRNSQTVLNTKHGFYYSLDGVPRSDVAQIRTIPELSLVEYAPYDVWITVFAGSIILRHEKSMLPEIGIIPHYCNKQKDHWWGKIKDSIDSQREHNKLRSAIVDVVVKAGNYGIGASQSAFQKSTDFERFKKDKNNPGFTFNFADGFQEHIHEFNGVKFPNELAAVAKLSSDSIFTTMGVNPQMIGLSDQSQESGTAMVHKQRQGFLGNDYILENMSASKRRLGSLIVYAIQAIDTPERILRLIENQDNKTTAELKPADLYPQLSPEQLIEIGIQKGAIPREISQIIQQVGQIPPEFQQILPQIQEAVNLERRQKLLDLLDNYEIQDYDVTVSESPWSPNAKYANFLLLSELFKGNPNAPIEVLIEEMPGLSQELKTKITGSIAQQQQAQMQLEQQKMQTELAKTVMARQPNTATTGAPGVPGQ